MKITYFGHSCFGLEEQGLRILMDPYRSGAFNNRFRYRPVPGKWDVVLISHDHEDHNHVMPSFGKPAVLTGPGEGAGLRVRAFQARHGDAGGRVNASTRIFRFELGGLSLVHPGDWNGLGDDSLFGNLVPVDVLFMPVGGTFTAGPEEAEAVLGRLQPKLVLPMHFKTGSADLTILPLEAFVKLTTYPVSRRLASTLDVTPATLPARTTVTVLDPECL